ncbi:hypothetical protein ACFE04_031996 [Oxalis oulophora]
MKHVDLCSGKKPDKLKRIVLDDLHVRSLQSRFKNKGSPNLSKPFTEDQIPLTSGVNLQTLNYIVTVGIGNQSKTIIMDTGSDLTWIQCTPCKLCYNQQDPLFSPSNSPTFKSVPCKSSTCQALLVATGNSGICGGTTCNYVVNYGDGSYTRGELGSEFLNLGSNVVKDFVFGCGRNNKGLFGGASGLMGLGKSSLSVVTQTSDLFGGIFSYCLPTSEPGASGSLVLGGDNSVFKNSTPILYTPMIFDPQFPTFYMLNLKGISIGGLGLQAPGFSNNGGFLIDSGTIISRLPPSIYTALKAEFLKQFSGYPSAPGYSILDTCFNLTSYLEVNIPTIELQFQGEAEINVDVTGIFYMAKSDMSQVCLAIASLSYEDEIGIIGNYQQRNQRVVYDTKESKLGFATESCSFS